MLDLRPFVEHAGQRFPIDLTLRPAEGKPSDGDVALRTVVSIRLIGEGFAQLSTLYLKLSLTSEIRQPCRRCLQPVTSIETIDEEFEVSIEPTAESVDLWSDVVRLVLSAHDPNVLCKKNCRGLCPHCGADLNQDPDHACESDEGDDTRTLRDLASWMTDS